MLSDEDLKCLEGHAMVGGVLGPWRDMLDLIDEVRRLLELVERLTAAGDAMAYKLEVEEGCGRDRVDAWRKAKGEGR